MPQSQPLFADSIMAVAPASRSLSEMSMDEKAGLYRALMSPLNLGYAMWFPFCFWGRKSNVDLGDVGWMTAGSFFPLFSTPIEARAEGEKRPNFDGNPPGEKKGSSGSAAALLPFVPLLSPGIDVVDTTIKPCSPDTIGSDRHFKFTSSFSYSAFLVPLGPVHTSTAAGQVPDESAVTKHHIRLPPEFEQPEPEPAPHEGTPLFVVTGCVKTAYWALGLVEGAGEFTLSVRASTNTSERQDFDVVVGEESERGPIVEVVSGPNVDHDWPGRSASSSFFSSRVPSYLLTSAQARRIPVLPNIPSPSKSTM